MPQKKSKKHEQPLDLHVHKGDTVMVITGRSPKRAEKLKAKGTEVAAVRGTTGEVLRTLPSKGQIVVKGVNVITKAMKPTMANPTGGLVKKEAPIPANRVMPVCPSCTKPTRVRHAQPDPKKPRVRVCAKCGGELKKKD